MYFRKNNLRYWYTRFIVIKILIDFSNNSVQTCVEHFYLNYFNVYLYDQG